MKNSLLLASMLFFASSTYAGEAMMTGQARILAEPDYVSVSIQIRSLCYATPQEARKANDKIAREIYDAFDKKLGPKTDYNKIITRGGYTQPYSRHIRERNVSRIICDGTYQKNATITIFSEDMDNFEKLFDDIQNLVYSKYAKGDPNRTEVPLTYTTLNMPQPQIKVETRQALEKEVMHQALANAEEKLRSMLQGRQVIDLEIEAISETPFPKPEPIRRHYGGGAEAMMMKSADVAPAPVNFDKSQVTKTIYVRFTFEDIKI